MKSNKKLTPRWYFISSIIMVIALGLELTLVFVDPSALAGLSRWGLTGPLILFAFTGIIWILFNFVVLIYFLAKKYEKLSLIVPIAFIIQTLILIPLFNVSDAFGFIEVLIFSIVIIGYSLYSLWKV